MSVLLGKSRYTMVALKVGSCRSIRMHEVASRLLIPDAHQGLPSDECHWDLSKLLLPLLLVLRHVQCCVYRAAAC
jgi:hypothetical protein